jgi:hypothetical protein
MISTGFMMASSGPCLVVASGVDRARALQGLIEHATGRSVMAFHDCTTAIDAIENHPGFFSAVVVDRHVSGELSLEDFRARVGEEEPGLPVQMVGNT